ncbi:MAG: Translational regulator CsrA [Chlamydiales bacterium]|nr:Translational regulator CsrA [Chlamydiales bacterium]MCH9635196.1 Translational regulator CsrA [Chlamydiales bacterium]
MLVLTRKREQKIRIGDDVVITVLKVQGDQVSIGIEAPKSLPIVREELLERAEELVDVS